MLNRNNSKYLITNYIIYNYRREIGHLIKVPEDSLTRKSHYNHVGTFEKKSKIQSCLFLYIIKMTQNKDDLMLLKAVQWIQL